MNLAEHCLGPAPHRDPDKVALVVVHDPQDPLAGADHWTYAALDRHVRVVARALLASGLAPGDRLLLRLGNTVEFALAFFGAIAAGVIPVPTSSQLTEEEAAFIRADSGAVRDLVVDDVRQMLDGGDPSEGYAATEAEHPAYLIYTSGTTGVPKGVLHAHRAVLGRRPMYAGWLGLESTDVLVHAGALNWTYTLGVGLMDPWAVGATGVVYNGPRDPLVWPRAVAAVEATIVAAVPGVYRQWLARWSPVPLPSLRHAVTAGEALAPSLHESWCAATGVGLYESLGMSEISTFVSSSPTVPTRVGSPGRAQPGRRIAVLPMAAEEGSEPLFAGEQGLLAVHRSDPGLMLGYWNRPEEEAEVLRGEWFVSSDLVHLDADGYVHHHGRADDVMNAGGYRVSPLEVEHVLEQHPAVAEVGVTDVPVREGVSVIAAFVVPVDLDEPGGADAGAILAFAREHLAAYKCPREVVFVDSLPRTANGKVIRRALPSALAPGAPTRPR